MKKLYKHFKRCWRTWTYEFHNPAYFNRSPKIVIFILSVQGFYKGKLQSEDGRVRNKVRASIDRGSVASEPLFNIL